MLRASGTQWFAIQYGQLIVLNFYECLLKARGDGLKEVVEPQSVHEAEPRLRVQLQMRREAGKVLLFRRSIDLNGQKRSDIRLLFVL